MENSTLISTLRCIAAVTPTLCCVASATRAAEVEPQQPQLVTQTGHSFAAVSAVAFAPNGQFVLTGGWDSTARLWDTASGREIRRFHGHAGFVTAVAFSPDGRSVLTGSADGTARLWDTATGEEIRRLVGHFSPIASATFSADGQFVLTSGAAITDRSTRIWDVSRGKVICSLQGDFAGGPAAFSPDGRFVVTGSVNKNIASLWDITEGQEVRQFIGHSADIRAVAFSPDGHRLLTGSADKTARLWETGTGREIRQLKHARGVWSAGFSHSGRWLATGGSTQAHVWNADTGEAVRVVQALPPGFPGMVKARLSPDERHLLTGVSNMARLWDVSSGDELRRFHGFATGVSSVACSRDGRYLITADGSVRIWDTKSGKISRVFPGMFYSEVALSPDDRFLMTAGRFDSSRTVRIWDVETQQLIHELFGHAMPVRSIAWSPDGRLALTAGGKVARLWDAESGQEIRHFRGHEYEIASVAFSPDGQFVLTGGSGPLIVGNPGGTVRLWETDTAREVRRFQLPHGTSRVAFSPDGRHFSAGSVGVPVRGLASHVVVWDATTGKETRRFAVSQLVASLAFSPDGRVVAAGCRDHSVHRWELATGKESTALRGHSSDVEALAFSPAQRLLVTASNDGTRVWNPTSGELMCQLVSFGNQCWVAVNPEGRFDSDDPDIIFGLHWIVPDDPDQPLPVEVFMRDYFEPRLLAKVVAGNPLPAVPDLSSLNRVQPVVKITKVEPQQGTDELVSVTVKVASVSRTYGGRQRESGMRDLHLFRDGQLVGYETLQGAKGSMSVSFKDVRLPNTDAEQVNFTAYAFNSDRVKSETSPPYVHRFELPSRKGRAYVVSVGVDRFEHHQPATFGNLRYAVNDATVFSDTLVESLNDLNQFQEVVPIKLTSARVGRTPTPAEGSSPTCEHATATKKHIKAVLDLLAGRRVEERVKRSVPNSDQIEPARPGDMVLISFSTHGYTRGGEGSGRELGGRAGEFYLVPSDIGDEQGGELLDRCISAEQLSSWLRDVDGGEMVMIIDACQSAGSAGQDFKPGPLGNRGLGQLAYNKRMRILAASQITQPAKEVGGQVGHGLLSYALLKQGLEQSGADHSPKDRKITIGEWLKFGERQVPILAEKIQNGELRIAVRGITSLDKQNALQVQQPVLFDFAKGRDDALIKQLHATTARRNE